MNEVGVMPLSAKLKKGVTQTQQTGHCLIGYAAPLLSKTAKALRLCCQAPNRKPRSVHSGRGFSFGERKFAQVNYIERHHSTATNTNRMAERISADFFNSRDTDSTPCENAAGVAPAHPILRRQNPSTGGLSEGPAAVRNPGLGLRRDSVAHRWRCTRYPA